MSIDMILGMAESQTQSIKNLVTKQNEAYTELQKSLAEFILQTDKLKGVTYDSAKKYCAVVIEPLVRGCILLNEEISRANENYVNIYKSEVDTVSLKQHELERLIREAESQIRRVEHLLNLLYQEDPISYSQISMAEENKETYRKLKNELEEKLRKLLAFNAKSPSFFSEVEVLKSSVDQGLAQAEKSWSPTSKTFNLPSRSDMEWASVIESIDAKYTAEKERLKSENNNKLTDQEYDRVISQITGINGKPLFGASVIKNASPEEKKDLFMMLLPWIIPGGGTLKMSVSSGGFLGGLEGIINGDKPSEVLKKMAFGGLGGYGLYKIGNKVNIREQLKNYSTSQEIFKNYQVKWLAHKATHNSSAEVVTLGKYKQNGVSYLDIAKKYEDTYFDMGAEGWNKALKMVNGNKEEMWRINKQFLDNQIAKGKTIRLSHDPKIEDGSYFNREIDYLKSKEYIIDDESIGGIWYAKPRTD